LDDELTPIRDIQAYCDAVAKAFRPRRIILFGSHAVGQATPDSDVDLLVEMEHRGHPTTQAIEIRLRTQCRFPLDLLVRSPAEVGRRIRMNDWFIRAIIEQGKVLYAADNARVGRKSRSRLSKRPPRNEGAKVAQL
jgi:predicted nucleotidyltransferase